MSSRTAKIITFISALGIIVTSYLLVQHYKPANTSFCNFNSYVSCDIVNKSEYSEVAGIPVSALGLIAYVYFFVFGICAIRKSACVAKGLIPSFIFALGGLAISLTLTYIEFFVLYAICIFCLTQQLLILLITILLAHSVWSRKKLRS